MPRKWKLSFLIYDNCLWNVGIQKKILFKLIVPLGYLIQQKSQNDTRA